MKKGESSALRFKAYKAIKDKIMHLEVKPGEKIFENELAGALNVSRTPVREALLMLEHEKLVVCNDSLGFMVRRFTAKDVNEYFAVRLVIEELVLSLVIENIEDLAIDSLKENIKNAERLLAQGDISQFARFETEFHEILYRTAKSDVLFETISMLSDKFHWFRALALSVPGAAANSLAQHKKILDALIRKDLNGLKRLMKSHLAEAKTRLANLPGLLL